MKKIKSLSLAFVTILVVMSSGAGCNKSGVKSQEVVKSSEAAITAFSFDGLGVSAIGDIDSTAHTIAVGVRTGTDITALKATFATTGAIVKVGTTPQVSGSTPNDFTSPVTYIVTAQDGSSQNYTVTVTPTGTKYVTIPDANFLDFLKTVVSSAFGTGADANKLNVYDNHVTSLTSMNFINQNAKIADLTGIEYFIGLTSLNCLENNLTSLDVSKNTALTQLVCADNKLTALDVSNNTALKYLYCDNNQLTSLDVSKNTALTSFSCADNNLTSLDVSENTALVSLNCISNDLTSLNVDKNTALTSFLCGGNSLTSLDVSKNPLTFLNCSSNSLTTLDVSKNTALTDIYCSSNSLTTLDVSKNTALARFICNSNSLTTLDISSQKSLDILTIYSNPVGAGENPLTTLKVNVAEQDNPEVKKVKTNNPSCVISTYTNNSTEDPVDTNYNPQ